MNHLTVEIDYVVRRKTFRGWEIRPRYIPNYELVLVIDGNGWITMEDETFSVGKGDLVFFRPEMKHSLFVREKPYMEFFGVHFMPTQEMDRIPIPDKAHIDSIRHLESQFKTLLVAYRQIDNLAKWRQNLLAEQLLCDILTMLQTQKESASLNKIQKVLRCIHEDPFREMPLTELLQIAGIQKSAFLEQFRHVTGTTPTQYITGLRLEYARDLLIETDLPVGVVAERCGFSDPFYFSRCFKKRYMLSPNHYRQAQLLS